MLHSCLKGVTANELWWRLLNMNVFETIERGVCWSKTISDWGRGFSNPLKLLSLIPGEGVAKAPLVNSRGEGGVGVLKLDSSIPGAGVTNSSGGDGVGTLKLHSLILGVGVTKAPFVTFSAADIPYFAQAAVKSFESHSYLIGRTSQIWKWYWTNNQCFRKTGKITEGKTGLAWWRHQMETFSALLALRRPGQWRGGLMFSLICAWTNGWANHRDAIDLRRHRDRNDVTVMVIHIPGPCSSPVTSAMPLQSSSCISLDYPTTSLHWHKI